MRPFKNWMVQTFDRCCQSPALARDSMQCCLHILQNTHPTILHMWTSAQLSNQIWKGFSQSSVQWNFRNTDILQPVVAGRAEGGSFRGGKKPENKKHAFRMHAQRPTSVMPKPNSCVHQPADIPLVVFWWWLVLFPWWWCDVLWLVWGEVRTGNVPGCEMSCHVVSYDVTRGHGMEGDVVWCDGLWLCDVLNDVL